MNTVHILGIDPGLAHCGWGVLQQTVGTNQTIKQHKALRLLDCGEITTPSSQPLAQRLDQIYRELQDIFTRYQPAYCGLEELYFNKNSSSALPVAHARGVALLCAAQNHVPVSEFNTSCIKQAVTGNGRAVKTQVQEMVLWLLGLKSANTGESIRRSNHAADALATAICLVHHQSTPQPL